MKEVYFKHIFSSAFVLYKNIDLNHDEIFKDLKKLNYVTSDFSSKSYVTNSIKIFDKMKKGKLLRKTIGSYVDKAIKDFFQFKIDHKIINVWGTKTKTGGESMFHKHIHFWLSFCYYPHGMKKDEFKIKFNNSNEFVFDVPVIDWNEYNSREWTVDISKGDLLIFPSNLKHQISKNTSNNDRYSIAGNILPYGKIGIKDSEIFLEAK